MEEFINQKISSGGVGTNMSLWIKADSQVFSDLGTTEATNNNEIEQCVSL